jgi:hypothetical protein
MEDLMRSLPETDPSANPPPRLTEDPPKLWLHGLREGVWPSLCCPAMGIAVFGLVQRLNNPSTCPA